MRGITCMCSITQHRKSCRLLVLPKRGFREGFIYCSRVGCLVRSVVMPAPFCRRFLLLPLRLPHPSRSLSSAPVIEFLTDSCGLSPSAAVTAAASAHLAALHASSSLSNPHAVLSLLRSHNFSPIHIASIVSARPSLLVIDTSTLLPKLRLLSAAFGSSHLPTVVTSNPSVLHHSLDKHLVPLLNLLRSFILSTADLLTAIHRSSFILTCNFRRTILPNITLLLTTGVPTPRISALLAAHPSVFLQRADHLAAAVALVQRFGLNPTFGLFTHAVRGVSAMGPGTLDKRLDRLRELGWSEDDISTAFRRAPLFLLVSDVKLERTMGFLVNTVGWSQGYISSNPKLLMYSLEKRIMPRFAVVKMLAKQGLFDGKVYATIFLRGESDFLHRYVIKYSKELPELMHMYQSEIGGEELDSTNKESG